MIDPTYIKRLIQKGEAVKEKAIAAFSLLSLEQLNWEPPKNNWSIHQCLEHLILSDRLRNEKIVIKIRKRFRNDLWGKINPFSNFFGRMLVTQTEEKVHKRVKSPKLFLPPDDIDYDDSLNRYLNHLDAIISTLNDCIEADIDKVYITSPISGIVTYSLRDAMTIIIGHECRHIIQAVKIKKMVDFPSA